MQNVSEKFIDLIEIVTRLRAPDGCPWDQKQTPQTFKGYLIEEAHELFEAINEDNAEHICEELGDLLFQIIFLNNLYQEKGLFQLSDVIAAISAKMIRRHPHVFADERIDSEVELRKQWQAIKETEKKEAAVSQGLLDSIPRSLPVLRRAQKIAARAARVGFQWPDVDAAFMKCEEELGELKEAIAEKNQQQIDEEMGDLFFSLVILGRKTNTDCEDSLRNAIDKFTERFDRVNTIISAQGRKISEVDTAELLAAWATAKNSPPDEPKTD